MRRSFARIKGVGFLLWHGRHEFYHVLLGLVWAWYLRERWQEFNPRWIWISIFGSLLPDADHFFYWFTYGKRDRYTVQVKKFLREHQWRSLWVFLETGHKQNTNLITHNYFFMVALVVFAFLSSFREWQVGVILFGAMVIHYSFDVLDDLVILHRINPNWKRWGRVKKRVEG